jgi:AcrR family transcriptional regulator
VSGRAAEAPPARRQAARSEATRGKLIEVGIELFSERGFAGVGTEELVDRAKVTRGALYHHFGDKRDLFRAVHEELEQRIVAKIAAALEADPRQDPLEALEVAAGAVLDVALDSKIARVTLIDAPSVLGLGSRRLSSMRRWRRVASRSNRYGRWRTSWWQPSARRRSWLQPPAIRSRHGRMSSPRCARSFTAWPHSPARFAGGERGTLGAMTRVEARAAMIKKIREHYADLGIPLDDLSDRQIELGVRQLAAAARESGMSKEEAQEAMRKAVASAKKTDPEASSGE